MPNLTTVIIAEAFSINIAEWIVQNRFSSNVSIECNMPISFVLVVVAVGIVNDTLATIGVINVVPAKSHNTSTLCYTHTHPHIHTETTIWWKSNNHNQFNTIQLRIESMRALTERFCCLLIFVFVFFFFFFVVDSLRSSIRHCHSHRQRFAFK